MKIKTLKMLSLCLLVFGMTSFPLAQAGKPQDVQDGVYGHRIAIWDPSSLEFEEGESAYILYGWYYLDWEKEEYPMPIKMEVWCEGIEFKVFRFTRQLKQEGAVSPTFFFYVLFEPYTFNAGGYLLEVYFLFHGEPMLYYPHYLNILPDSTPM